MRVEGLADRVLKHWLALVLAPMTIWALLPFLAPVAMNFGWEELGEFVYIIYRPFCHQLPQRSWFFFGEKLTYTLQEISTVTQHTDPVRLRYFYGTPEMGWRVAWSDRMISFYTMTPLFGLLYAYLRRYRRIKPISLTTMLLAITPIFLDGVSHMVNDALYGLSENGFRDMNGWLASLTGKMWPTFYAGDHFGTFNWWVRLFTGLLAAWGLAFWAFPLLNREIEKGL